MNNLFSARLTPRQRQVLRYMAYGMSNKEIAAALEIARGTVCNHVRAVISASGEKHRTGAVLWAIRWGVVDEYDAFLAVLVRRRPVEH